MAERDFSNCKKGIYGQKTSNACEYGHQIDRAGWKRGIKTEFRVGSLELRV